MKKRTLLFYALLIGSSSILSAASAHALTINVVNEQGQPISGSYRWLVEEDRTYSVIPGVTTGDTLSTRFHTSHSPIVAKGDSTRAQVNLPSDKRYFVSILPYSGFAMGGAPVAAGQTSVTITVNSLPLPTAQISVFVFEDNEPINNEPDLPQENGLKGFQVLLFDAAGRYGQAGGQISQDIHGNPLGTTYDARGRVVKIGSGILTTDENGIVRIQNLAPGKYGIQAVPPQGQDWHQTATIEGTKTIDAWVKANEPPYFMEFGPPGHHVFIGFVKTTEDQAALTGTSAITGRVVSLHNSRPPNFQFWPGNAFPGCWIGLNDTSVGRGRAIYAKPCNEDSTFSIEKVPPGNYQLVIWDENLDLIFGLHGVTVQAGQNISLGDIPVFPWFARLEHTVFLDRNQNGFRDCITEECNDPSQDDVGIPEQMINLRFRDGTLYQSFATDMMGYVPFDEVFPFFSWLVTEVDYARFKPTGVTTIVDNGGPILPDQSWVYPSRGKLTPQPQFDAAGNAVINPNTQNNLSRTETGNILTKAFQTFLGQTNILEWGKAAYGPSENGGISGIVHYATTRAENDPRYANPEEWEPGIPRVQVNLYEDANNDGKIDDKNGDLTLTPPDVDNYPLASASRPFPQAEDLDHNSNGSFDLGDAIQITHTDSWDDNPPSVCQGEKFIAHGHVTDCYDGLRNFNQVRDGVFDGGYLFTDIPQGIYIVEAIAPAGYQHVKEEDKNVDFGEEYTPPATRMKPAPCVGEDHLVPPYLSLFPAAQVEAPFAGKQRPLCDRKQVVLSDRKNGAANFFLFTEVPKSSQVFGRIVNDLGNEFDRNSPSFGEKFSPPFIPVSIRDFTGREIARTYSDEWGSYNALLPSSYTMNAPYPSGVSPNMLTACLNSPGPIPNPDFVEGGNQPRFITDPHFNRAYSQFCYTFQYMPGTTTYLDTPVLPVAAFASNIRHPVDCEMENHVPKIYSVSGPQGGPYVSGTGQLLTIVSEGEVDVPNPAYDPALGNPKTIRRDYGFGAQRGRVLIGDLDLTVLRWDAQSIQVRIPSGVSSGQLTVIRGDNQKNSLMGVTVTVGGSQAVHHVQPSNVPGATPIQDAIDRALPNDLILVAPGNYEEMVIVWKPVRLQGWGPGSAIINALAAPAEKLQRWRTKVEQLLQAGRFDLLPGQPNGAPDAANNEPLLFGTEEGPVILVVGKNTTPANGGYGSSPNARIDGFTLTGSSHGGGVFVNGYAPYLHVSNNRIVNNQGTYGGGIRVGHPTLIAGQAANAVYPATKNEQIKIHHNHVTSNGSLAGAGAGISIGPNSHAYDIRRNYVCGNFSQGDGGGIGHLGTSNNGRIRYNKILFNQTFNQTLSVSGGGLSISGAPSPQAPQAPQPPQVGGLSPGSGSVKVLGNLFQGNIAGAGDGGAIRLQFVNGSEVLTNPNLPGRWYHVELYNNIIANNVSGLAGAISLQDAPHTSIIHNTIANNDSTATAGEAFTAGPSQSVAQPAGIVSRAHTDLLTNAIGTGPDAIAHRLFSNPRMRNNIVWHNRSFYWDVAANGGVGGLLPGPNSPQFSDLAVLGTAQPQQLDARYSLMTSATGYHPSNLSADPRFVRELVNGSPGTILQPEVKTAIETAPAFDEGGNFIDIHFGPLSLWNPVNGTLLADYHLQTASPAINRGSLLAIGGITDLYRDYDRDRRPLGSRPDIGADEKR